ncbi:MAG: ATP synthase F1 subunit delta [Chloroflexi bacterium]|nr:ATP synthase F1 subunit delta [Chloroflexota bacterium]
MPTPRSTARRYAEAATQIADRDGTLGDWVAAVERASERLSAADLMRVLSDPAIPFADRRRVAEQVLGDTVTGGPRNLVLLLVRRGRIELLPQVAAELRRLHDQRAGIATAVVTSAAPLTPEEAAAVSQRLSEMTGDTVQLELQVDPSLLGGVQVRIGDRLIDGSVRGRLERLRSRLAAGAI